MISLFALWLPILLSAVAVFILSSIIHLVLGYHRSDVKGLPQEARIMEALREIVMYEQGSHIDYDAIPPEELEEWPQQAFIGGFRKYAV